MKKMCIINLSHLTTLILWTSLGMTIVVFYQILINDSEKLLVVFLCPIVIMMIVAIILRITVIYIVRKNNIKFK